MLFKRRWNVVKARHCKVDEQIETANGVVVAKAGDWILTDANDMEYPCSKEVFLKTYEPYDIESRIKFREVYGMAK